MSWTHGAQLAALARARAKKAQEIAVATAKAAEVAAIRRRVQALSRTPNEDDQARLLLPARVSFEYLRAGRARIDDLHNIVALLNTALVLAGDVGEYAAQAAIQDGLLAIVEVKDRKTERMAMNAEQRERIAPAVDLADELLCCCTLLEIARAHTRLMGWLPMTGELKLIEVETES